MTGGNTTVTEASEGVLLPPSVEVAVTLLLFTPAVVPVTLTLNVQDAEGAPVTPVRLTLPEPAVAVMIPAPHVPVSPFGVATTSPAGSVSVNATLVSVVLALGLVSVKVSVVLPFKAIEGAPKTLVIVGG